MRPTLTVITSLFISILFTSTLFVSILLITTLLPSPAYASEISIPAFQQLLKQQGQNQSNPVIIDLRTKEQYAKGHIPGALHITRNQLINYIPQLKEISAPIILYDQNGDQAAAAVDILEQAGIRNAKELNGSLTGWVQAGGKLSQHNN